MNLAKNPNPNAKSYLDIDTPWPDGHTEGLRDYVEQEAAVDAILDYDLRYHAMPQIPSMTRAILQAVRLLRMATQTKIIEKENK